MRTAIWTAAALPLFGLACGQKEPPGTDTPGSDAGTVSYFPLVDGASYRFLHSRAGWIETVNITAVEGERDTFEQTQSPNPSGESGTSVLVQREGEVLRVAEDQFDDTGLVVSVTYDPGFLRFADAWVDESEGFSETRTYERAETEVGKATEAPQPRAHLFTVEEIGAPVTVPAGTFRNCVVIRRGRVVMMSGGGGGAGGPLDAGIAGTGGAGGSAGAAGGDGIAAQDDQEKLFWFAPGIGKVREENVISGAREELIDYEIPE